MPEGPVLADNDLVFKLSAYLRHGFLIAGLGAEPARILPATKFVLRDLVRKSRRITNRDAVRAAVEDAIAGLAVISPSPEAIALAAEFEETAKAQSLELDTGESLLLAIALTEPVHLILTGDKRAVAAIEVLASADLEGRIACLEQVLAALIQRESLDEIRAAVCSEPRIDTAATMIFGCHSRTVTLEHVTEAIGSYVSALRKHAARVLADMPNGLDCD